MVDRAASVKERRERGDVDIVTLSEVGARERLGVGKKRLGSRPGKDGAMVKASILNTGCLAGIRMHVRENEEMSCAH